MCLATFLTVIGLAVLLLSDFVPTRRFAELTIVTLTGALVGALFLLPACVAILWKRSTAASHPHGTPPPVPNACQIDSTGVPAPSSR